MKKSKLKKLQKIITCYKDCGNIYPSKDMTICLNCGSGLKIKTK